MYVCMHILSYHVRAERQDGPGGTSSRCLCAFYHTKRAASDTGGRGASVEAMDAHDDDGVADNVDDDRGDD